MKLQLLLVFSIFCTSGSFSQSLYFPPLTGDEWETLSPDSLNWCDDNIMDMYDFLESRNTKAFILLKGGKIVLEKYFGTFTQDSAWYWASAGKTVTATLTGIAKEEGLLELDDPTSDYLGEGWTAATTDKESLITIWHQLTMMSGLDDEVPDVYCTDPDCLIYKVDAGTRWAYHNGPYTNLTKVIEAATGVNYNQYYFSRLAQKTGMGGLWIYVGYNRLLFSTARTMARFGLLIQNGGSWGNTPVLTDADYVNDMIQPSQSLNESYGYLWWLNGQASYMLPGLQFAFPGSFSPDAPDDMYAAMGANGQYLNISPGEDMLFVRMGEAPDSSPVPVLFNNEIWQYINELECTPNSTEDLSVSRASILYPNPVRDILHVRVPDGMQSFNIRIFDVAGKELIVEQGVRTIDLSGLRPGMYQCILDINGTRGSSRFVKL